MGNPATRETNRSQVVRAWCEDLPLEELSNAATVRLIAREAVSPLIAVCAAALGEPLERALNALSRAGVRAGLWPVLAEEDGYWANERNVSKFAVLVERVAAWVRARDLAVKTIAVDIEPPDFLAQRAANGAGVVGRLGAALAAFRQNRNPARLKASRAAFARIEAYLRLRGFETLAAGVPLAILDHGAAQPIVEDLIEAPVLEIPWDRISWMTYTSLATGYLSPIVSREDARALLFLFLKVAVTHEGARAGASVGVTSTGQLRDEEPYRSPTDLALDIAAARAASVRDIAVYSLEGLLARSDPERWFRALLAPPERPRIPLATRALFAAAREVVRAASIIAAPA